MPSAPTLLERRAAVEALRRAARTARDERGSRDSAVVQYQVRDLERVADWLDAQPDDREVLGGTPGCAAGGPAPDVDRLRAELAASEAARLGLEEKLEVADGKGAVPAIDYALLLKDKRELEVKVAEALAELKDLAALHRAVEKFGRVKVEGPPWKAWRPLGGDAWTKPVGVWPTIAEAVRALEEDADHPGDAHALTRRPAQPVPASEEGSDG